MMVWMEKSVRGSRPVSYTHLLPPGAAGKRLLKDAFKREFPRSANAYLTEAR